MMQPQAHRSIESLCRIAGVSRAGFYRHWQEHEPRVEETELRAPVQPIVLTHRGHYGYRRVPRELHQQGWGGNHKRVARIMREDNLLCVPGRRFLLTTDSNHKLEVYVNLAARLELSGMDQLWGADLTYIRLREQFVYVAVILDAFSRRVVGWALDESLPAPLATAALQRALALRRPAPGLVHHSDRGIQYACHEYVNVLQEHGILPSMSRPGNPYDNAKCESFIKTLKQEEIYTREYRHRADLQTRVGHFLEQYYNRQRLHSALNYRSPEQFEQRCRQNPAAFLAPSMSFFRHEEIYRPDVGQQMREEQS